MERLCLNCEKVLHGRADKKFCDDACRSSYNFEHNNANVNIVRRVNQILKKNREILMNLNPDGTVKVPKSELTDRGFNFNFYTSIYETEKKDRYFYCYDMGYLLLGEKMVLLVVKDNYLKLPAFNKSYNSPASAKL